MQLSGEQGVIEQYMIDRSNCGNVETTQVIRRRLFRLLVLWLEKKGVTELEGVTLPLLRQFLSFLLQSSASDRCEDVGRRRVDKLAPSTVATYVSYLKAFFHWCYMEELTPSDVAVRLQIPKVPEKVVAAFTSEQQDKLVAACDTSTRNGFRNYVIVMVLLDTGMRVSELCGLRLSDVHPKYVKVNGKGHKEREIGLHPNVSKLLWKYVNKERVLYNCETEFVFVGERGALTARGVSWIVEKIKEKSGIEIGRSSPHVYRHTHSKEYLKRGGDLFKLSRELGHSNVSVTANIYLGDFKSSDARDDHDKYSPVGDIKPKGPKGDKGCGRRKKR